ncbi:MAG: adenosylcobalamin-dependent ribonucleoside-diphosphate reductase [Candidatus Rehaiarchaeum fermentans]|nr:adenosylcobalamin-dependent ribonucleoside-diphosphate reductase [Candidatus Rehaiarchaeum fermentans]MCW1297336.1 adenosylcobalamin-dependent ribonucleoside-diphosphate reductase [Candidatus Rehaiarchaeum fermentans]
MAKNVELPKETLEFFNGDEFRARVFYEKYALRDKDGSYLEKTPVETWKRTASEIASVEKDKETWSEKFYWLLEDFKFVPGGRILFGAGSKVKSTLINCYFIPIKEDSIEGIYDCAKEMARTYSYGGGVGIDISILRPKDSPVNNAAITSTGAVSFMELYSLTTGLIGQSGRRGALMITIDVSHPDVEDFVTIKADKTKVRYANISVKVNKEFMEAVKNDKEFELYFKNDKVEVRKKIRARDLWYKMIKTALETGDPGIIFWDRVKEESPSDYDKRMELHGTNPCAEEPLEDYGVCDLGSINLSKLVKNSFTDKAELDWETLEKLVRIGVRFLDDVLDYNYPRHPLKEQAEESVYSRRIGLGVMGLADMFIRLGIKYDSEEAIEFSDKLFKFIKEIAYDESSEIAKEKGSFPGFDAEKYLERPFAKRLPEKIREKIRKQGLRNVALLSIAPTGSISSMAGVSNGIEPIFALSFIRRSESLSKGEFKVFVPIVEEYMQKFGIKDEKDLPPIFVTAHKIDPYFRVKLQATIQKHIDASISSTVNLPSTATLEDVNKIYLYAWELGCKSITVYREGSKEDILKPIENEDNNKNKTQEKTEDYERPLILEGNTVKLPLEEGSLYVTVNKDNTNKVKEVFVTLGKVGEDERAYTEAIGKLISMYLQKGGDVEDVIKKLKGIKGSRSKWFNGIQLFSVPDAVAKAIEISLKGTNTVNLLTASSNSLHGVIEGEIKGAKVCPVCGQQTLVFEAGCFICKNCGYTKCE